MWPLVCLSLGAVYSAAPAEPEKDYPVVPVPFTQVTFEDTFWAPRLETNRATTVPYDFRKCEETGRIDNFAKAGGLMEGAHKGIFFDDSDVFKVVEGAAYCLALKPDAELDEYLDALIAKFAAAQEEDGYLYTQRSINPEKMAMPAGKTRWSHLIHSHELYNVGHMYEAAAAHFLATGKRNFLDVALKNADLIDRVFGPDGRLDVPGHEEIEIGLSRLYRVTGEQKYLDLAKFFVDMRGREDLRKVYGEYCQDHQPVVDQAHAVGHAVRAGYLYAAMADMAALTGDARYTAAIGRIWDDVVTGKLYLTGGIGARRRGEAFGDSFELPNASAYNETCAAIASAMWNHRLFLLHGESKYIDVLERTIYNGFLSGIAFTGDAFFYPNPLESDGAHGFNQGAAVRQPWFGCSCCPTNVVRFLPSLLGYAYAQRDETVYVNLFVQGTAAIDLAGSEVKLAQKTAYPWDGKIEITYESDAPKDFVLALRVPGWAQGQPVPSGLYRYIDDAAEAVRITVNGEALQAQREKGFAMLERTWEKGDTVVMDLPMPVRRVLTDERVEANRHRVALERGPIVYCAEGADNDGHVLDIILGDDAKFTVEDRPDLLHGVRVIRGGAQRIVRDASGAGTRETDCELMAVPYYAWCHRGANEMAVWLARDASVAKLAPLPTIASKGRPTASHVHGGDALGALNDQLEPKNSNDRDIPRFTWWAHRGTAEWVAYEFAEATEVRAVEVYWFDDTGGGSCRVPVSWTLLYRDGDAWTPVSTRDRFGVGKDTYTRLAFDKVKTTGLRIEVRLQEGYSGGLLEWRVE